MVSPLRHRLQLEKQWAKELVSLQLYGRAYGQDPHQRCPCRAEVVVL